MKRTPKYFYLCTDLSPETWINDDINLISGGGWVRACKWIGTEYWPHTRAEARLRPEQTIMQFENKPPYKFVKIVR